MPTMKSAIIVARDSRTLTPIAVQSTSLSGQKESVPCEDRAALVTQQDRSKQARRLDVRRRTHDRAALLHARIGVERNLPESPLVLHWRGYRERQRDDADVGRSALDELERLRHVFTE